MNTSTATGVFFGCTYLVCPSILIPGCKLQHSDDFVDLGTHLLKGEVTVLQGLLHTVAAWRLGCHKYFDTWKSKSIFDYRLKEKQTTCREHRDAGVGLPEMRMGRSSLTVFMELTNITRCSWCVSSCCRSSIIFAILVIPGHKHKVLSAFKYEYWVKKHSAFVQ